MRAVKKLFERLVFSVVLPTGIIVASFYIFNALGNLPVLIACVLAFAIGAYAIHLIFKYWVSTDQEHDTPQQQMMRFMIIFVVNATINAEIVYLLVTYAYVPILQAQAIAAVIVAYESYYAYRSLVFKTNRKKSVAQELAAAKASATEHDRSAPHI